MTHPADGAAQADAGAPVHRSIAVAFPEPATGFELELAVRRDPDDEGVEPRCGSDRRASPPASSVRNQTWSPAASSSTRTRRSRAVPGWTRAGIRGPRAAGGPDPRAFPR